uniref:Uncharacterized protein n=1 Tax=Avena sativa TaxID=4498 RepID=A0ACD5Z249_AVESA
MDEMLRGLPARGKLGAATNQWMTKLQEMAYHIEDGIDDFMQQLGCAGDKDGFMRDVAKQLNLKVRHQISRQIQELKALVAEEGARDKQFSMRLLPELAGMSMDEQYISVQKIDPRVMALYADADHQLVGMDGPVDEILELLTLGGGDSAAQQLQIVSIIGPGGLGKTTLANQVHRKIKGQFDYTVLVSVSERPNMKEILRKILPPGLSRGDSSEVCQLAADARKYLQDKR